MILWFCNFHFLFCVYWVAGFTAEQPADFSWDVPSGAPVPLLRRKQPITRVNSDGLAAYGPSLDPMKVFAQAPTPSCNIYLPAGEDSTPSNSPVGVVSVMIPVTEQNLSRYEKREADLAQKARQSNFYFSPLHLTQVFLHYLFKILSTTHFVLALWRYPEL